LRLLSDGARLIRERDIAVLIFPEGGRSEGKLTEFREGAAYVAIKAGVPAVPLGITGTRESLPMGRLLVYPAHVRVAVGDPIPTEGLTLHDRARLTQQLCERVRELTGQ
jgi:1-acyl-sn-glycerol-3-phosphate acyltransferase